MRVFRVTYQQQDPRGDWHSRRAFRMEESAADSLALAIADHHQGRRQAGALAEPVPDDAIAPRVETVTVPDHPGVVSALVARETASFPR